MKLVKAVKIFLVAMLAPLVFLGGVLVGNSYNLTDILCPSRAQPYRLETDFISKDGIVFPRGTVIDLRRCAYMQRFEYRFAIDNAIRLPRYHGENDTAHGFAELFPATE